MTDEEARGAAHRLLLACDMFEFGREMMRQNLERRHPTATEAEIDAMLVEWVRRRDCAPMGDSPGTPLDVEEFLR